MIYFDTSYLGRLYFGDLGYEEVRHLAGKGKLACSQHGRTELLAAFHRRYREGAVTHRDFLEVLDQFLEEEAGTVVWLKVDPEAYVKAEAVYRTAPKNIFLRAADAMHLACAAENGFKEIYSNDRHLLAAAPLFGLRGRNVIGAKR